MMRTEDQSMVDVRMQRVFFSLYIGIAVLWWVMLAVGLVKFGFVVV